MPRRRSLARIVSYVAMGSTFALAVPTASAQVAVSSNDNKVVLDNGVIKVVKNPPPDTVSIIDMKTSPQK